ncbi:MAG: FKBP-type peptidyl-prolyl cis-trans isomerase [Thermoguttaceae bacterium]|jgi:peptidylprolyl isomerase
MTQVSRGEVVRVHYTGRYTDGTVFDSSEDREPLEFVAGSNEVIQGVSDAVVGMANGEKKTVTIPPEQGYGDRNPALEQSVPLDNLPEGVQEGDQLRLVHDEQEIPVWVREINEDEEVAKIDANHPLAGVTLVFDLELVSHNAGE